jgi:hypothetical protein
MNNKSYWIATVQLSIENDKGRTQKINEQYVVDAVSATDAEAKIYKEFTGESNFEVIRIAQSKIIKIIE